MRLRLKGENGGSNPSQNAMTYEEFMLRMENAIIAFNIEPDRTLITVKEVRAMQDILLDLYGDLRREGIHVVQPAPA